MRKLAANIVDNCLDEINRRISFDLHSLSKAKYYGIQNALMEIVLKNLQPEDSAERIECERCGKHTAYN